MKLKIFFNIPSSLLFISVNSECKFNINERLKSTIKLLIHLGEMLESFRFEVMN